MRREDQVAVMRIGTVAAALRINPKTIRYYEAIGIVPSPARSPSGYRLYGTEDRDRLAFILRAKQFGFSLDEIRKIIDVSALGDAPCSRVTELIEHKIDDAQEQLRALNAHHQRLLELRSLARAVLAGGNRQRDDHSEVCVCRIIEGSRSSGPE